MRRSFNGLASQQAPILFLFNLTRVQQKKKMRKTLKLSITLFKAFFVEIYVSRLKIQAKNGNSLMFVFLITSSRVDISLFSAALSRILKLFYRNLCFLQTSV